MPLQSPNFSLVTFGGPPNNPDKTQKIAAKTAVFCVHKYAYFKNFICCCRTTNVAFAFLPTFFKLSLAVFDVAADACPVKEVVARSCCEHMLAAGTQLLETYHTLTLQHVTSCQILTSMLQHNKLPILLYQ